MGQRLFLRDADIEALAESVYAILEKVGLLCQNDELLLALEASGARADHHAQRAFFPPAMVKEHVEQFKKEAGPAQEGAPKGFQAPGLPGIGTQVAQFLYEDEKGERSSGNRAGLLRCIRFGEAVHPEQGVGHALVLSDAPPEIEPLETGLLLAEYAGNPHSPFAWTAAQVPYLREMGEIMGRENWFTCGAMTIAHPLRLDKGSADKLVLRVKLGAKSIGLTAMPIAGVTTPVTAAGFAAVSCAEQIAVWICGRALNPAIRLGGSVWPGTVDMKTGEVSYCAFDALWYGFVTAEFIRRFCGVSVAVSGGDYCDAKSPGWFAVLEKAYKVMTLAAFTGRHSGIGVGLLEEGKTLSLVQLLLERDYTKGIAFYGRTPEVTPESIGLEAILDAGLCIEKNYLEIDHTARHFRDSLWLPGLFDRSGYTGFEQEEAALKKAQARVNDLIASYRKPDRDPDKLEQMRQVVKRASRALAG